MAFEARLRLPRHVAGLIRTAVGDALIPVELPVNHRSIAWDDRAQEVALYHIELASHDVLVTNGAPAESWCRSVTNARRVPVATP